MRIVYPFLPDSSSDDGRNLTGDAVKHLIICSFH
jgi:hypothetical protein